MTDTNTDNKSFKNKLIEAKVPAKVRNALVALGVDDINGIANISRFDLVSYRPDGQRTGISNAMAVNAELIFIKEFGIRMRDDLGKIRALAEGRRQKMTPKQKIVALLKRIRKDKGMAETNKAINDAIEAFRNT